nr:MAG TPA_asm: hypothetical protein [Caudoviricetes sp.]
MRRKVVWEFKFKSIMKKQVHAFNISLKEFCQSVYTFRGGSLPINVCNVLMLFYVCRTIQVFIVNCCLVKPNLSHYTIGKPQKISIVKITKFLPV